MQHRGIIDEDIQPALLLAHTLEQRLDLQVISVVTINCNSAATCSGNRFGSALHGSRQRRITLLSCAPGNIDGGSSAAQS